MQHMPGILPLIACNIHKILLQATFWFFGGISVPRHNTVYFYVFSISLRKGSFRNTYKLLGGWGRGGDFVGTEILRYRADGFVKVCN
jgi:hypothetical protein